MATDSYAYRRAQMLESLKQGGISDKRVMEAMAEIPRHYFVPEAFRHQAYDDDVSIHIGEGQTISQPRIVALMTESRADRSAGPCARDRDRFRLPGGGAVEARPFRVYGREGGVVGPPGEERARSARCRQRQHQGHGRHSGVAGAGAVRRDPGHRRRTRGARASGRAAGRRRPAGRAGRSRETQVLKIVERRGDGPLPTN